MNFRSQFFCTFFLVIIASTAVSLAADRPAADSVGVEKAGGQSFIIHQVEPKETLFGISRRYQSPVGDIIESNPILKQGLKIGQKIRVPFIPKSELPAGTILHNVVPGETLFSISRKYGLKVEDVMKANGLKGNDLSVGQSLIIESAVPVAEVKLPEPSPEVAGTTAVEYTSKKESREKPAKQEKVEVSRNEAKATPAPVNQKPLVPGEWRSHTVQAGETLFSIAGQYGARVEDLITWNALTSNNLRQGQALKVGRGAPQESVVPIVGSPKVVSNVDQMMVEPSSDSNSGGFKNIKETGQAELIEGTGGHKKYLVLHRTAPVGTIMRVKNEENDVTIFARVVGTLPETGDNSKLVIKLSQAAFDQLKAVNGRFPVEIMY